MRAEWESQQLGSLGAANPNSGSNLLSGPGRPDGLTDAAYATS